MITTLFFDLGNVLVHFDHEIFLGRISSFTNRDIRDIVHSQAYREAIHKFEIGSLQSEQFYLVMNEMFNFSEALSYDLFCEHWSDIFWVNDNLVAQLRAFSLSYRLGIISNTNELHLEFVEKKFLRVFEFIQYRICSYRIGCAKPSAEIFEYALRASRARPEDCFYTDDIAHYISVASSLGMHTAQYVSTQGLIDVMKVKGILSFDECM